MAAAGKTVLLVSTDPASNVGQVFGLSIGNTITAIPPSLGSRRWRSTPNRPPTAYRERIIGPVRGLLPEAEVVSITEQLSGSCTTEIASFNEFTELLTDSDGQIGRFDHVLFDTAPTGHTIRLLQLPGSWTDFLNAGKGDASCLGPLAGLDKHRSHLRRRGRRAGRSRPHPPRAGGPRPDIGPRGNRPAPTVNSPLIGLNRQYVVINAVLPAPTEDSDPLATAIYRREQQAIARMPDELRSLPHDHVDLKPTNIVGVDAFATLFTTERRIIPATEPTGTSPRHRRRPVGEPDRRNRPPPEHGLVMCMGKGGVGKTTDRRRHCGGARRPRPPRAPHHHRPGRPPRRHTARNAASTCRCRASTPPRPLASTATMSWLPKVPHSTSRAEPPLPKTYARRAPRKSLSSKRFPASSTNHGTSSSSSTPHPTGHTLLLLDTTGSYHRDIARQTGQPALHHPAHAACRTRSKPKSSSSPWPKPPRCSKPRSSRAISNAPASTPGPGSINNSLAAANPTTPLLRQRALAELPEIDKVRNHYADRVAIVPLLAAEPVGIPALEALTEPRAAMTR